MRFLFRFLLLPLTLPRRLLQFLYAYDIFISYAHEDGPEYARALDQTLSQTHTVHLDTRDLHPGQTLDLLTRVRVRSARLLVVVARPASLGVSKWVRREVDAFHETGRAPVLIDVDNSIAPALDNPTQGTLSEWLAEQRVHDGTTGEIDPIIWISDNKGAPPQVPRLPDADIAQRILDRFDGDRIETRRLRVVTGALGLMFALTLGALLLSYAAYLSERRATSEALANAALSAATGSDLDDGFAADALLRISRALAIEPTSNVLAAAARLEGRIPSGLAYAARDFAPLGPLVVTGDGRVFVKESNHSVHEIEPSTLSVVNTWSNDTLSMSGIGNVIANDAGFTALSARNAVRISPEGAEEFSVPSWHVAESGGIRVFRTFDGDLDVSESGSPTQPLNCLPDGSSVAWHSFIAPTVLAVAGREVAQDKLWLVDIENCYLTETVLRTQPMFGTVIEQLGLIVIVSPTDIAVFNKELNLESTVPLSDVSAIAPINSAATGFAVGDSSGSVAVFTLQEGLSLAQTDRLDKVLPGTVLGLAYSSDQKRLVVSGRLGFFVNANLPGALASLPLSSSHDSGIVFDRSPDDMPLYRPDFPHRVDFAQSLPDGIVFATTEEIVFRTSDDGVAIPVTFPSDPAALDMQLSGLSAFNDEIFVAWGSDASSLIQGVNSTGALTFRAELGSQVSRMAAGPNGVLVLLSSDERTFEDGQMRQTLRYLARDETETTFEVAELNSSQQTFAIDPTGQFVALARTDGFEFRSLSDLSNACLAPLGDGENSQAGVAAAFSPDGNHAVLGSWGGRLSIWRRDGSCWTKGLDLAAREGRMIPTLWFDGRYVLGRTLEAPAQLRRWDANSGEEIGVGYALEARAMRIVEYERQRMLWVNWLPFVDRPDRSGIIFEYVTPDRFARFDFMPSAIVQRACKHVVPLRGTALVQDAEIAEVCPSLERNEGR